MSYFRIKHQDDTKVLQNDQKKRRENELKLTEGRQRKEYHMVTSENYHDTIPHEIRIYLAVYTSFSRV